MDISKEIDIDKLKAMAYDELQRLTVSQQNIQVLQSRIAELSLSRPSVSQTAGVVKSEQPPAGNHKDE